MAKKEMGEWAGIWIFADVVDDQQPPPANMTTVQQSLLSALF
jgi:hypothetical protein